MNTKNQYFDRLCRACMNEVEASPYDCNTNPQRQWKSIFERIEECAALRVAELLSKAVVQIKVKQTDELPKKICWECMQTLLAVYRFQQMCIQSEVRLLEIVAIKGADLNRNAAMESEVEIAKPESSTFKNFCESSSLQNLQHSPIQESVIETTKQIIEPDIEQPNAAGNFQDNDSLLELCTNPPQDDFGGFVKNEPIDDDEHHIDYSDSGTMHSVISVTKHEVLSIESEKKQVNVTSSPYKEGEYLSAHGIKADSKKSDHACELCGKKYGSRCALKRHSILQHSTDKTMIKFSCDFCDKHFLDSYNLRRHVRTHTGERPYSCQECGKSFSEKGSFTKHRLNVHASESEKRDHLRANEIKANNKKSDHACELCGKKYSSRRTLKRHSILQHSTDKTMIKFSCDFCDKHFIDSFKLRRHVRTHTGERPYSCQECGKSFSEKGSLKKHRLKIHPTESEKRDLNRSRPSHGGEDKLYECPYCPVKFRSNSNMARHRALHEGRVKKEACDICGKSFRKSDLKRHKETHNDEKAFKCDMCEKRFSHKWALKLHIRTHTAEKPFKCKYCELRFSRNMRLLHLRTHLGENVHRCEFCPSAFRFVSELRSHIITHKNEDPETRERNLKALKEEEAKLVQNCSTKR